MIPAGSLPVLPLKNTVLYPGIVQTLRVGREKSIRSLDKAQQKNGWIVVVTQKNPEQNVFAVDDLYDIGTLARIELTQAHSDGGYTITVKGTQRVRIRSYVPESDIFEAHIEAFDDILQIEPSTQDALMSSIKNLSQDILKLIPANTTPISEIIAGIEDLSHLTHLCASNADFSLSEKQKILETVSIFERSMLLLQLLQKLKDSLQIQKDIRERLSSNIGQNQREHLLREQMKAIREELGENSQEDQQIDKFRDKINELGLKDEARELALSQLKKLEDLNPNAPDYQMTRAHLELMLALPWNKSSEKKDIDLDFAEKVLHDDHYGLKKIKQRILQHLAVLKLRKDKKGSILLFIGPPGVGKTSLGQSIAKALNKKYVRISLGGVRDEAEIRGHRRTYIGALPGRLIQALKKVGENDPVIVLDEIDKMSHSFAGDPTAAMLEVLDPEQNFNFVDHYLDTGFDLSNVFFIATANSYEGIPRPLLDRLEVIDLSGYTTDEKFHIAKTHLIPKQMEEHGLTPAQLSFKDEAILKVVNHYTREAGVRELQRKLAQICRHAGALIVKDPTLTMTITTKEVEEALGPQTFNYDEILHLNPAGVVNGLAWTPVGGDILFIETATMPGKGDLIITGQLGDVMKESAQIARSLIKARLPLIAPTVDLSKIDIHLHVPSGAIPKDGPSAGITLLTSLASLLSKTPVDSKLAMTGEISLRGAVLPVGGIKEKVIAAHRAGIRKIIMSAKNEKDLIDVPEEIKTSIEFKFVAHINEVLKEALNIDLKDFESFQPNNTSLQTAAESYPSQAKA